MSCMIFGTTGLCGKAFLEKASASDYFSAITSVTRRPINNTQGKVKEVVEKDINKYVQIIQTEKPQVVFSALATTLGAAGSAKAFVDIDYGINLRIAQAAKKAGADTFVIISSVAACASSPFLYLKTKGRLENDIIALGFPRTIILRPGPLLGEREASKGIANDVMVASLKYFHNTFLGNNLFFAISGSEVATAAEMLIKKPREESLKPIVEIIGAKELIKLKNSIA